MSRSTLACDAAVRFETPEGAHFSPLSNTLGVAGAELFDVPASSTSRVMVDRRRSVCCVATLESADVGSGCEAH